MKGQCIINGVDIFTEFGVFLEETSYNNLLLPPPTKEHVKNDFRSNHGTDILIKSIKKKERDVTLVFGIKQPTKELFISKYKLFTEFIVSGKIIQGKIYPNEVKILGTTYKLVYVNATAFGYYKTFGKLTVRFNEPNPNDRLDG
ncbi:MAG: hypothetical protein ACRDDZ_01245 [Marinifilaceae bacterium]